MMHRWGNLLFNQPHMEADYWSDDAVYAHVDDLHINTHTDAQSSLSLCTCECFFFSSSSNYHKNKDARTHRSP